MSANENSALLYVQWMVYMLLSVQILIWFLILYSYSAYSFELGSAQLLPFVIYWHSGSFPCPCRMCNKSSWNRKVPRCFINRLQKWRVSYYLDWVAISYFNQYVPAHLPPPLSSAPSHCSADSLRSLHAFTPFVTHIWSHKNSGPAGWVCVCDHSRAQKQFPCFLILSMPGQREKASVPGYLTFSPSAGA